MQSAGRKRKRIQTVGADRNNLAMGLAASQQPYSRNLASLSQEPECAVMLPALPLAVVEEVLLNVPAEEVVCVCRLVCREWKELVDSAPLWKTKCRRAGFEPSDLARPPADWRLFYFLSKKRRNLLKNPRAEEWFRGWQIVENGGDKWSIEDVNVEHPFPDETVKKFFVTSYNYCRKLQLINLEAEGYAPAFLDTFQPDILVSDWYAPRWDCGSIYEICVELLNKKKQVIAKFCPETVRFEQWNDMEWKQMTHVFRGYGRGARFVRFCHGGKDTQFWAGWYGIRITNSSVEVGPSTAALPGTSTRGHRQ